MMAAESIDPEIEIWRRVLDQTWRKVKKYLIPDPIIDLKTEYELFTFVDRRDIKEEKNTTEKNEAILKKVRSKGVNGYNDFIKRLKMANQCNLADLLTYAEEGKDSSEIEQQLDVMVEETLSEYTKLKSNERKQEIKTEGNIFQRLFGRFRYRNKKKELKEDLMRFYKWSHSKVLLSPLFEEKDTPLASFYIRPELTVNTLQEMFETEGVANREIYFKADAGLGKTTFSKYLATCWYQAHCLDEKALQYFEKNDIDCMRDFDFLFLVLLRDSNTSCSVDDLIFKLIVSNLENSKSFTEDFLQDLLSREKCLVILYGLDEWTHPNTQCERKPRSIPHRKVRKNCTILTTTRPWKLGDLNLSSNELGKTVELIELSYISAVTLTKRTLLRLRSPPHNMSIELDGDTLIKEIFNSRVAHLAYVPLLLMYMICLRCEGFNIGNSKCELYVKIVELLLLRTTQKHGNISQTLDLSSSDIPACFAEHDKCKEYFPLLINLGQLAYYTLSNETKENTLVFDVSVTQTYLTQEEMKFTLHSGILSQSTTKTLIKKVSKVSFSHKTVQEFFAAILISSHRDAKKIFLQKCANIKDILNMSKICEVISEMNSERMCAISNDLMSVINEDYETQYYRTTNEKNGFFPCQPLYEIQNMFILCFQEMPENENIHLCLQDFFIDEDTVHSKQLQRLLKQNKTNIISLCIHKFKVSESVCKIIDLFSLTDLSHIQKLYYNGTDIGETEAKLNWILFPSLRYVSLDGALFTPDKENLIELPNLLYLRLSYCTISHKVLEGLFNFISGQKSIKELKIVWLNCKEHGRHDSKIWNLDVSKHSNLTNLDLGLLPTLQLNIKTPSLVRVMLWRMNLDEKSWLLPNIKRVVLREINMFAGSLQNFITVLEKLSQSVIVKMNSIKPEPDYERVRANIRSSQFFYVIRDNDWFEFETR